MLDHSISIVIVKGTILVSCMYLNPHYTMTSNEGWNKRLDIYKNWLQRKYVESATNSSSLINRSSLVSERCKVNTSHCSTTTHIINALI